MVGHTHDDIDALFGTLWTHSRNKYLYTPQDYKSLYSNIFKNKMVRVVELTAIPDYKSFFSNVSIEISHAFKGNRAPLHWRFKKTEKSGTAYFAIYIYFT